jgi:alpha-ribazole phosphatase
MTKTSSPAEFTCIDFLRHGECEGGEIFRGSGSDVALTDKGWQQMRGSVQELSGWDSIITSPLQRCRRFATEQSERLSIPLTENTNWREIHFGDWEGRLIPISLRRTMVNPLPMSPSACERLGSPC